MSTWAPNAGSSGGESGGGDPDGSDEPRFATDLEAEEAAREIALRQLNAAPRSRAQLEQALAKRLIPAEVAERVLDRFTEVGLVDDREYARMVVRTRHSERGLSRRAIAVELRRKGIDEVTAGEALDQVDGDDERSAARALIRRKLGTMTSLAPEVRRRRVYAALGRRGYGAGLVAELLRDELVRDERAAGADGAEDARSWLDEA